jgi:tripartite-type tricarboxylate transporter receptor subunit TctC
MRLASVAFCALLVFGVGANAQPVSEFYKGKQVQVIVGYGSGGAYDIYARLIARHMPRHLPGTPSSVVQNMPGAGSLRAANYLYNSAPKDGTVFGTFARNMPMMGVLGGNPNVQFDARRFTWLGSPSSMQDDAYLLFVRTDAKAKNLDDARRPGGPEILIGVTGEGASGNDIAHLIRDTIGLNFKLITGYPDGNALSLAVDRGEIEGRFLGGSSVAAGKPEWLQPQSPVRAVLQFARTTRHPSYKETPTARELARDERALRLIELAEIPYMLARPYVAPPDLPGERAAALQKAFIQALADPVLVDEASKLKLDISPVGAKDAMEMLRLIADAPSELKIELKKLSGGN